MHDNQVFEQAKNIISSLLSAKKTVATVESCTGGLVAAALTEVPGSSAVLNRGWVTYTNAAKHDQVGVPEDLLAKFGAVSEPVARAMAEGALHVSPVDIAVSVTGLAGPGGGEPDKPVGLVFVALAQRGLPTVCERHIFAGDRSAVRQQSLRAALRLLASI